ncbi:cell division protein ZapA [Colwellia hornerae]|uniref:Cell division protein ZapA n=1 Tax=Colwellia hornerae TaxID=89402 RepID=A0A5C6Q2Q5_9GAMM|nr:cell division protein ZapA [Colwellia hornerae]TWX46563.1 cell division protein ZapA [Colwellia hornerae]TWX54311.1 cell division protein ZapA [Colwellia hornerae]TWX63113.1 cell division protein ZapA [Colwellia hornerae]
MSQHSVTIEVANRRLKISCPSGQESSLLLAAEELNQRLLTDSKTCSIKTPEQSLVMTALNLSNDLLAARKELIDERAALQSKIDLLQATIKQAVISEYLKKA